jgi:hypothetical protein
MSNELPVMEVLQFISQEWTPQHTATPYGKVISIRDTHDLDQGFKVRLYQTEPLVLLVTVPAGIAFYIHLDGTVKIRHVPGLACPVDD